MPEPLARLAQWLAEATEAGEPEPAAMALATVSATGEPSVRIVSLKEIGADALVFTTTLYSRKALELAQNPQVALSFWWPRARRQVRVAGEARVLDRATAERLFADRPLEHRLQTLVSRQGEVVDDLEEIRRGLEEVRTAIEAAERAGTAPPVPCPEDWGAVAVVPSVVEFWEERPDRIHERVEYARADAGWHRRLLAP